MSEYICERGKGTEGDCGDTTQGCYHYRKHGRLCGYNCGESFCQNADQLTKCVKVEEEKNENIGS